MREHIYFVCILCAQRVNRIDHCVVAPFCRCVSVVPVHQDHPKMLFVHRLMVECAAVIRLLTIRHRIALKFKWTPKRVDAMHIGIFTHPFASMQTFKYQNQTLSFDRCMRKRPQKMANRTYMLEVRQTIRSTSTKRMMGKNNKQTKIIFIY